VQVEGICRIQDLLTHSQPNGVQLRWGLQGTDPVLENQHGGPDASFSGLSHSHLQWKDNRGARCPLCYLVVLLSIWNLG
jgi:hypothetical protein